MAFTPDLAECITLDSDSLTIALERLLTMKVMQTLIRGKRVYSAGN